MIPASNSRVLPSVLAHGVASVASVGREFKAPLPLGLANSAARPGNDDRRWRSKGREWVAWSFLMSRAFPVTRNANEDHEHDQAQWCLKNEDQTGAFGMTHVAF